MRAPSPGLWRGRSAVASLYLAASVPPGSWIGRIPDIKAELGASDAAWGLTNSLGTTGELVGFVAIVVLIGRLSTRRIAVASALVVVVSTPLLAFAPSLTALIGSLLVWLMASKALGTTMGALALVEQRRAGRVLMGHYDAVYSVGMFAGGALAWVCIRAGVSPNVQFAATNLVLLVALVAAVRHLPDEDDTGVPREGLLARLRRRWQPTLIMLAGISFMASIIDGTVSQWGGILLTEKAGGDASWGALVYPTLMATKILILLRIDQLVRAIGWSMLTYLSAALAGLAVILGTSASAPPVALIGLSLLGAGTAVLGPMVNTAAGEQPGVSGGEARTMLELGEIPAYLAMPALIGFASVHAGLGPTLQVAVLCALLGCCILTHALRPTRYLTGGAP